MSGGSMKSFWPWLIVGVVAGVTPALVSRPHVRAWWAKRWWRLSLGIALVGLFLPFGLVLIMFISDAAVDAMHEMWLLWSGDEFRWLAGLALGWLTGSSIMAWRHRRAPKLQGPAPSDKVMALAHD